MNNEQILNSDVLDILFENKNKDYGAYQLRKFYNSRLMQSLGIAISVVLIISALAFIPHKKKAPGPLIVNEMPIALLNIEQPKEQQPEQPKVKTSTQKVITPNIVMVPNTAPEDTFSTQPIVNPGTVTTPGQTIVHIDPGPPAEGPVEPTPVAATAPEPVVDKNAPMEVEVEPQFPGGTKAFRKYLETNLRDPNEDGTTEKVTVKIRFIVGYDGKLRAFDIVQDGGTIYNDEVKRVLKKMPEWIPGKSKGQDVTSWFTIPVVFVPSE